VTPLATSGAWTTADYALIVSMVSLCFAVASFVWNVWSKFIFPKPRVEVKIAFTYALGDGGNWPPAITLTAINHGPLEVTLKGAIGFIRPPLPFGKSLRAILKAYTNWPYTLAETDFGTTPGLPVRVPVGEQFSVHFPEDILKNKKLTNLGFKDGFDREHFADRSSRQNLLQAKRAKK